MNAHRNADGTITIPARIEQGGIIGEGEARIGPDDPDYQMWDEWLGAAGVDAAPDAEQVSHDL